MSEKIFANDDFGVYIPTLTTSSFGSILIIVLHRRYKKSCECDKQNRP